MTTDKMTKRAVLRAGLAGSAITLGLPALAQSGPGVTDKEIRLGTWIPLTGPLASYGLPFRAGIDAAIGAANAAGGIKGRKVLMIVEDNAYNPQRTVAAARKLISRDEVLAIAMPFGAVTSAAFDYVLGEAKVPMLNPWGSQIDWFQPPRPGFFGCHVLYENQNRTVGRWIAKDGHKSVIVLHSAIASYQNVASFIEPGTKSVNDTVKVEMMASKLGTTDYAPTALEIVKKNPACVTMIMPQGEVIAASKELRQQGYKGELYTYAPSVSNSTLELAGAALEGVKSVALSSPLNATTAGIKAYRDALSKYAPSETPDYTSLISYAMMVITLEALRRIDGPMTRDTLVKSVYSIRNFETGILPPVSYTPERHLGVTSIQRVVGKGGQWVAIGTPVEADQNW